MTVGGRPTDSNRSHTVVVDKKIGPAGIWPNEQAWPNAREREGERGGGGGYDPHAVKLMARTEV